MLKPLIINKYIETVVYRYRYKAIFIVLVIRSQDIRPFQSTGSYSES